jgi:hypothetical protein
VKSAKIVIALVVVIAAVLGTRWLGWWGKGDTPSAGTGSAPIVDRGSANLPPVTQAANKSRSAPSHDQIVFDDDPKGKLRIEGQVIDEKDQGVAGAQVAIDSNPPMVVTTEQGGNFVFEGLIPRDYRLEATGGDGYAGPARLRLTEKVEPITLRMKKGGTVEVSVSDGTKPIAGAGSSPFDPLWTAKTDARGVATCVVSVRCGTAYEAAASHQRTDDVVVGRASATKAVSIVLERGAGSQVASSIRGQAGGRSARSRPPHGAVPGGRSTTWHTHQRRRHVQITVSTGTWRPPRAAAFSPATSSPSTVAGVRAKTASTQIETGGNIRAGRRHQCLPVDRQKCAWCVT